MRSPTLSSEALDAALSKGHTRIHSINGARVVTLEANKDAIGRPIAKAPKPAKLSYEKQLGAQLQALGIECQVDVVYLPGFKYRADVLIAHCKLVVEVQGGVHRAHKDKFARDILKAQRTIEGGFTLLPVSPKHVQEGSACKLVERLVKAKNAARE